MDLFTFDDEYVRRLREGDREVEDHFYAYFTLLLRAKTRCWLGATASTETVQDILQEVFVRTFNGLGKLRDGSKLGAFVNAICTNVLHEAGRNGNRVVQLDDEFDVADQTDLNRDLESERNAAAVRLVLATMALRDAELLRAAYIDGVHREELCTRYGVSQKYLRVLLLRARDKFRVVFIRLFGRAPDLL